MKFRTWFVVIAVAAGLASYQFHAYKRGPLELDEVVKIAALALMGQLSFSGPEQPVVRYQDGRYRVSIRYPVPGSRTGETYERYVEIDGKTKEVLDIGQ